MSTEQGPSKTELEAEIHELRRSVGETVEALTYKLDVKARAQDRVRAVPRTVPIAVAVAVTAGLGLWWWRRRT